MECTREQNRENFKIYYIIEDSNDLLDESIEAALRVSEIVQNLKSFARIDQGHIIEADMNENLVNTLKIIWNELKKKTSNEFLNQSSRQKI